MIFWLDDPGWLRSCAGLPRQSGSDGGSQTKAGNPGLIDGIQLGFRSGLKSETKNVVDNFLIKSANRLLFIVMGTSLLEFLSNSTFVNDGKPAIDVIAHAPVNHILDFCRETVELTNAKNLTSENGIFTHSASLTLSGGRFPCEALNCRLKRVEELAQFAALYSEKVYVKNLFSDHILHVDTKIVNESALKQFFADELQIYLRLKPLIEAGIVIPTTPPFYCPHCLLKKHFSGDAEKQMATVFRNLAATIKNDLRITASKDGSLYCMEIDDGNKVFDHVGVMTLNKIPPFLAARPRLLAQIKADKRVKLTIQARNASHISEMLASEVMQSIVFELTLSQCLNTSFLTNRDIDKEYLRFLTADRQVQNLDNVIEKNLTALIPFLKGIEPASLLKLRNGDQESFILFRKTMRKVIAEYTNGSGKSLTQHDARAIYGDILEPELARLTKKLEKAKKTLLRSAGSTIVGWTAALSVGTYTGLVTGDIVKAAAALGLTKVLANLTGKIGRESDTHAAIRDENLYFLWKVKRESERSL